MKRLFYILILGVVTFMGGCGSRKVLQDPFMRIFMTNGQVPAVLVLKSPKTTTTPTFEYYFSDINLMLDGSWEIHEDTLYLFPTFCNGEAGTASFQFIPKYLPDTFRSIVTQKRVFLIEDDYKNLIEITDLSAVIPLRYDFPRNVIPYTKYQLVK